VNLADLALLYVATGAACAVAIYRTSTESRPRAVAAAALAIPLWPLWAPVALTARRPSDLGAPSGPGGFSSPSSPSSPSQGHAPVTGAAAQIEAALREGAEACAGTALEALLPRGAAERIRADVARASARHAELTSVLGRAEFDGEAAARRVAELERAAAEAGKAGSRPARALRTARLHLENVRRLEALRDHDARALDELLDLVQALRTQLVLARFAGSSVEGVGGIVSEVWARVEGLGAALSDASDASGASDVSGEHESVASDT
jgi:hypothetical protein